MRGSRFEAEAPTREEEELGQEETLDDEEEEHDEEAFEASRSHVHPGPRSWLVRPAAPSRDRRAQGCEGAQEAGCEASYGEAPPQLVRRSAGPLVRPRKSGPDPDLALADKRTSGSADKRISGSADQRTCGYTSSTVRGTRPRASADFSSGGSARVCLVGVGSLCSSSSRLLSDREDAQRLAEPG